MTTKRGILTITLSSLVLLLFIAYCVWQTGRAGSRPGVPEEATNPVQTSVTVTPLEMPTMTVTRMRSNTATIPQITPCPECTPPCWCKIVPGGTNYDEVNRILASCPDILIEHYGESEDGSAVWLFRFDDPNSAYASFPSMIEGYSGTVKAIYLNFKQTRSLQSVIEDLGVPEKMVAYLTGGAELMWYKATLLYPTLGLEFYVVLTPPGAGGQFTIQPSDKVYGAVYFEPQSLEELQNNYQVPAGESGRKEYLHDWPGFGPIDIHPDLRD